MIANFFAALSLPLTALTAEDESPIEYEIDPDAKGLYLRGSHIYQEANYHVSGLNFQFLQPDPRLLPLAAALGSNPVSRVEDSYHVSSAYLSWEPQSWLSFDARLGTVQGEAKAILAAPLQSATFQYDGHVYGFGTTLKYRHENSPYFALINAEWNQADFGEGSSNEIWLLKPKVGMDLGEQVRVWVGATRQQNNQKQSGEFNLPPFGPTAFQIELSDVVHWNYVTGIQWRSKCDTISVALEGGFGNRKHIALFTSFDF